MNNNGHSRLFHHFIQKSMPCILMHTPVLPPSPILPLPDQSNDHILNLSASMIKHCPLPPSKKTIGNTVKDNKSENVHSSESSLREVEKSVPSPPPPECESSTKKYSSENVDMNCNKVKIKEKAVDGDDDDRSANSSPVIDDDDNHSYLSDNNQSRSSGHEDQITEIDVDDSMSCTDEEEEVVDLQTRGEKIKDEFCPIPPKKGKILAFGIDRILSSFRNDKDEKSPTSSPSPSSPSPSSPVVSNLSTTKSFLTSPSEISSSKHYSKDDQQHQHHSILSKLRHCATATSTTPTSPVSSSSSINNENHQKRGTTTLPFFHHPYSPYHPHHHPHHINPIITSASGGGLHNPNSHQHHHHHHQHPLSNCSECLFLRRYCGGGVFTSRGSSNSRGTNNSIPPSSSSSSSSANTAGGAANNMQFSSAMANPCSSLSASFSWMANPTIYDSSAIISPVSGYNQHIPLQPSFGLGQTGHYSTLTSIQPCNTGGGNGRRKRSWSRAVFSNLQRKGLEKRFQLQKYITKPDRRQLAATLGLTDAQVKVWFQNRRMKWRHSKEGKVSSGTGEASSSSTVPTSSSSPPVSSTTSSKGEGAIKDKKL